MRGARSRSHEGTGIGLALVHDLVELHGGSVRVESVLDQGSTFTISIPVGTAHLPPDRIGGRRAQALTALGAAPYVEEARRWLPDPNAPDGLPESTVTAPLAAGATTGSGGRGRIVWADDNADMRDYVRRLLGAHYDVEAVADGQAALTAARACRPDLVLADVMMPELDGFGLLRALRADPGMRTLPVILLSARAGEESCVEGLEAGADAYLVKPFSGRELLAHVSAHIELGRMRARIEEERGGLEALFLQAPGPHRRAPRPGSRVRHGEPRLPRGARRPRRRGKSLLQALPELAGQAVDQMLLDVLRTGIPQVGHEVRLGLDRQGTGQLHDSYWTFMSGAAVLTPAGALAQSVAFALFAGWVWRTLDNDAVAALNALAAGGMLTHYVTGHPTGAEG